MPIYEYTAADPEEACEYCRKVFEHLAAVHQEPLKSCPKCGAPVQRLISAPRVGGSKSMFDDRAKSAGFHKLKKIGKGEYEKQY